MWVMSDRAIPRSFRFMEGFGVHTFRLINAKGDSTFVKFHWKPKLGMQSVAVERSGQDQRRRSRLPSPRPLERHPGRRLPGMGTMPADIRPGICRRLRLRRARSDQAHSRGTACRRSPVGRLVLDRMPDNFFAETEQVAFMTQNIVPGIDFSQRSAAAGAQFLLSRHAAEAPRQPELHAFADQRAEVPVPSFPAGWAHGDAQSARPRQLRTQLVGPRSAARGNLPEHGFRSALPRSRTGRKLDCGRRALPTTTARQGSSSAARRRSNRSISPTRWSFELSKVETPRNPRAGGRASAQHRRRPRRRPSPRDSG